MLRWDIAAEDLTKSCANRSKLCSVNCTQPVSHDVLSSLSRLAESRADTLRSRGMRVLPLRSWPKPSAALARKLSRAALAKRRLGPTLSLQSCASRPFGVPKRAAGAGLSPAALPCGVLPEPCLQLAVAEGLVVRPALRHRASLCPSVHPSQGLSRQDLWLGRSGESSPVCAPAAGHGDVPAGQVSSRSSLPSFAKFCEICVSFTELQSNQSTLWES